MLETLPQEGDEMRRPNDLKHCIFIALVMLAASVAYVESAPRYLSDEGVEAVLN